MQWGSRPIFIRHLILPRDAGGSLSPHRILRPALMRVESGTIDKALFNLPNRCICAWGDR